MPCITIDKNLNDIVAGFKAAEAEITNEKETSDSLDNGLRAMDLPFALHNNSPLGPLIPLEDMSQLDDLEKVSKAMNFQVLKLLRFMQYVISNFESFGLDNFDYCYLDNIDIEPGMYEANFKAQDDDLEFSCQFRQDAQVVTDNPGFFSYTIKSQSRNFALRLELGVDYEKRPADTSIDAALCNYNDADDVFKNFLLWKSINPKIQNTNFGYRLNSEQMQIDTQTSVVNEEPYTPEHSLHQANTYRYLLKSLGAPVKAKNWESEFNQHQQSLQ